MNWIKIIIYLLLFLIIYGVSFYYLGNTLNRIDSTGKKVFSIIPLFTEGFIGPLRTLWIMIKTDNIYGFGILLFEFLTNFWSPYAVILMLCLIDKVITS